MSERASPDGRPTKRRPRRWRLWVTLVVCLGLAGWSVHFAHLRFTRRPTPRPRYWEARLAEIDPLPDGGLSSLAAFDILNDFSWAPDPMLQTVFQDNVRDVLAGPWEQDREDVAAVCDTFASPAFENACAKVRDAAQMGWRDSLGVAPFAWSLDSQLYERWVGWLLAHSRWASQQNADGDTAVDDWLTVLRLGRQRRRGRLGYAWFQEANWARVAASEMMYRSFESQASIDTHALALEIDSVFGSQERLGTLLEDARLSLHCCLEFVYVREDGDWLSIRDAVVTGPWTRGVAPSRIWNLTSPLFHALPTARAAVDRYIAKAAELSDITACLRAEAEITTYRSDDDLTVLSGLGRGNFELMIGALHRRHLASCELDAGVTMLALAEYHGVHREYPQKLEALIPDFLPRLPLDYVDRQPLRYIRTVDDYLLYSIGEDRRDDGGAHDPDSRWRWEDQEANPDVVFSTARRPERPL